MPHGAEMRRFEEMLTARGVALQGDSKVEEAIRARYETHCAVMILDSSGFTRLTRAHGILHFLSLVVDMNRRVTPILKQHEASCYWFEADNVFGVFPSAERAIHCALEIQRETEETNAQRPPASCLDVCIGVGAGTLLKIGDENVYGDEMNAASKLGEDTAGPGEVLVTEAAWQEVDGEMAGVEAEKRFLEIAGVELPYFSLS